MSATDGPATRSAGGAMARGLLLIVVAVALGVIVLRATDEPQAEAEDGTVAAGAGVDDDAEAVGTEVGRADDAAAATTTTVATTSTTDGSDDSTGSTSTSTTTALDGRPPSEVNVLVANGSGIAGVASELTETVGAVGYETVAPSNVSEDVTVPASTVYFAEGYEADAAALAATLTPEPPVEPMPDPAPVDDLRGATVLVVVGPDLAGD